MIICPWAVGRIADRFYNIILGDASGGNNLNGNIDRVKTVECFLQTDPVEIGGLIRKKSVEIDIVIIIVIRRE